MISFQVRGTAFFQKAQDFLSRSLAMKMRSRVLPFGKSMISTSSNSLLPSAVLNVGHIDSGFSSQAKDPAAGVWNACE
jgi:hypothetical protein